MQREIFQFEQNGEAWDHARLGIPTASQYGTVISKGRGNAPSKTRRTYMLKLIGERMTGEKADNFQTAAMVRGHEMEDEAVAQYEFENDVVTERVGFIRYGETGASPDRLIGNDGLLEVKTKAPHLQLDVLLRGEMPAEHKPQVQGQLWVSDRQWCVFISYWPGLPLFVTRIERDEEYIEYLQSEIDQFNHELNELEQQVRNK